MFNQSDILNEKDSKILREVSAPVSFPMDKKDIKLIKNMIEYLRLSQDEDYAQKNHIRAGMGLAAVQLGVKKRFFVISYKMEDGTFEEYEVINPTILSSSEEKVYIEDGEGCLSVTKDIEGIIPRAARITIEYYDTKGNKQTSRVREEIAVAFQHEIDHLDGIIYIDRIDKKDPFKDQEKYRAI